MKQYFGKVGALVLILGSLSAVAAEKPLRPPSVPLVACDPYFCIWSPADHLYDVPTCHWTGTNHPLTSLVRVDDKAYRIMGAEPASVPPLEQQALEVLPTRTIYTFAGAGVQVKLTFLTPALPQDIDVCSRPVTYLTWDVQATDGKEHRVSLYYDHTAELAVNTADQTVTWAAETVGDLAALKIGSQDQPVLAKKGDNLRIDWGYVYVASQKADGAQLVIAPARSCREQFAAQGTVPAQMDTRQPRAAGGADAPAAAACFDLGKVAAKPVSRTLILAYDDVYSIQYFLQNLRPYWRRKGMDAHGLLKASAAEYADLSLRCAALDQELMADLRRIGGEKYARLCALAFRQATSGNKIAADANGQPLLFPKENFSNGCIGTVDVIYPMAPFFLLFGPSLTKAMLLSNFDYAQSHRWKFPFAPHDLGTYPKANGQVYGGGEETELNQMPVEESGNMLILAAALAQMEGNANSLAPYWPLLVKWAQYLKEKGFDPENQLCTDDFAGHLAHNVNLSGKAIVALGAFGKLCEMHGDKSMAAEYMKIAREFAVRWVKEADDGDHFRLALDKPGSWSQKYNLVWDRILGLGLFPAEALRKEMDFYKKNQQRYGLPLDNRQPYTKLDWTVWTATLTGNADDFQALTAPLYDFLNETPTRVPMTDWYMTEDGKKRGFQARPVVGGVLLPLLYDQALWHKWAARDATKSANWAPLPKTPKVVTLVPASNREAAAWRFTTAKPSPDWFKPNFDASAWKEGKAGFGSGRLRRATINTPWKTPDIWLRREIDVPAGAWTAPQWNIYHDEDVEIYLNGVLAGTATGFLTNYELLPLTPEAKAALKPGKNVLAVHCKQTTGGQFIDLGLVNLEPPQ